MTYLTFAAEIDQITAKSRLRLSGALANASVALSISFGEHDRADEIGIHAARKQGNKAGAVGDRWANTPRERRARTDTRNAQIDTSATARSLSSAQLTGPTQRGTECRGARIAMTIVASEVSRP